ncbi:MAG: class I SAM-dependent methyltransferase [Oceanospirillaceae bacterium]|nr:class I SAM-dependent methyltransferase [Oceanospirillaceae bacterium]
MSDKLQAFYQTTAFKPHRKMLEKFIKFDLTEHRIAVDCGCGIGNDTAYLLAQGYRVHAFDNNATAIDSCRDRFSNAAQITLTQQSFEDFDFPDSSLFIAYSSLFFCHPYHFTKTWQRIADSILSGGIFNGDFLGINDSWAGAKNITTLTSDQLQSLFQDFKILSVKERDEIGKCALGEQKHWHSYTIVARKI